MLNQLDGNDYVLKASAYIERGEVRLPGTYGRVMKGYEMIALELCDHGDLFDLVADHADFLKENPDTVKNLFS